MCVCILVLVALIVRAAIINAIIYLFLFLSINTVAEESTMRKQLELRLPGELKDTLQEEQKTYVSHAHYMWC